MAWRTKREIAAGPDQHGNWNHAERATYDREKRHKSSRSRPSSPECEEESVDHADYGLHYTSPQQHLQRQIYSPTTGDRMDPQETCRRDRQAGTTGKLEQPQVYQPFSRPSSYCLSLSKWPRPCRSEPYRQRHVPRRVPLIQHRGISIWPLPTSREEQSRYRTLSRACALFQSFSTWLWRRQQPANVVRP